MVPRFSVVFATVFFYFSQCWALDLASYERERLQLTSRLHEVTTTARDGALELRLHIAEFPFGVWDRGSRLEEFTNVNTLRPVYIMRPYYPGRGCIECHAAPENLTEAQSQVLPSLSLADEEPHEDQQWAVERGHDRVRNSRQPHFSDLVPSAPREYSEREMEWERLLRLQLGWAQGSECATCHGPSPFDATAPDRGESPSWLALRPRSSRRHPPAVPPERTEEIVSLLNSLKRLTQNFLLETDAEFHFQKKLEWIHHYFSAVDSTLDRLPIDQAREFFINSRLRLLPEFLEVVRRFEGEGISLPASLQFEEGEAGPSLSFQQSLLQNNQIKRSLLFRSSSELIQMLKTMSLRILTENLLDCQRYWPDGGLEKVTSFLEPLRSSIEALGGIDYLTSLSRTLEEKSWRETLAWLLKERSQELVFFPENPREMELFWATLAVRLATDSRYFHNLPRAEQLAQFSALLKETKGDSLGKLLQDRPQDYDRVEGLTDNYPFAELVSSLLAALPQAQIRFREEQFSSVVRHILDRRADLSRALDSINMMNRRTWIRTLNATLTPQDDDWRLLLNAVHVDQIMPRDTQGNYRFFLEPRLPSIPDSPENFQMALRYVGRPLYDRELHGEGYQRSFNELLGHRNADAFLAHQWEMLDNLEVRWRRSQENNNNEFGTHERDALARWREDLADLGDRVQRADRAGDLNALLGDEPDRRLFEEAVRNEILDNFRILQVPIETSLGYKSLSLAPLHEWLDALYRNPAPIPEEVVRLLIQTRDFLSREENSVLHELPNPFLQEHYFSNQWANQALVSFQGRNWSEIHPLLRQDWERVRPLRGYLRILNTSRFSIEGALLRETSGGRNEEQIQTLADELQEAHREFLAAGGESLENFVREYISRLLVRQALIEMEKRIRGNIELLLNSQTLEEIRPIILDAFLWKRTLEGLASSESGLAEGLQEEIIAQLQGEDFWGNVFSSAEYRAGFWVTFGAATICALSGVGIPAAILGGILLIGSVGETSYHVQRSFWDFPEQEERLADLYLTKPMGQTFGSYEDLTLFRQGVQDEQTVTAASTTLVVLLWYVPVLRRAIGRRALIGEIPLVQRLQIASHARRLGLSAQPTLWEIQQAVARELRMSASEVSQMGRAQMSRALVNRVASEEGGDLVTRELLRLIDDVIEAGGPRMYAARSLSQVERNFWQSLRQRMGLSERACASLDSQTFEFLALKSILPQTQRGVLESFSFLMENPRIVVRLLEMELLRYQSALRTLGLRHEELCRLEGLPSPARIQELVWRRVLGHGDPFPADGIPLGDMEMALVSRFGATHGEEMVQAVRFLVDERGVMTSIVFAESPGLCLQHLGLSARTVPTLEQVEEAYRARLATISNSITSPEVDLLNRSYIYLRFLLNLTPVDAQRFLSRIPPMGSSSGNLTLGDFLRERASVR